MPSSPYTVRDKRAILSLIRVVKVLDFPNTETYGTVTSPYEGDAYVLERTVRDFLCRGPLLEIEKVSSLME